MNQCPETESGGVRCELPRGHEEGHWISPETINARLYHRITLITPQALAYREAA